VASGGDIPSLVQAVRDREAQRRQLVGLQRERRQFQALDPRGVQRDLEDRMAEWREVLGGDPGKAPWAD
jgi:hypothetical protein